MPPLKDLQQKLNERITSRMSDLYQRVRHLVPLEAQRHFAAFEKPQAIEPPRGLGILQGLAAPFEAAERVIAKGIEKIPGAGQQFPKVAAAGLAMFAPLGKAGKAEKAFEKAKGLGGLVGKAKAVSPELQPLAQEARKFKSAEEFVRAKQKSFEWWNYYTNPTFIKQEKGQQILLQRSPILSPEDVVAEIRGKPRLEVDAPIIPITRYEADKLDALFVESAVGGGRQAVARINILPGGEQTGLEGFILYDLPLKQPLKYGGKLQTIPTPQKEAVDLFNAIRADRANRIFRKEKTIQRGLSDFELQIDRSQLTDFYNQAVRGIK